MPPTELTTTENPAKKLQVQTNLPRWVIDLLEIDAIPHEGKISVVLRKLIVAAYQSRKPKGVS